MSCHDEREGCRSARKHLHCDKHVIRHLCCSLDRIADHLLSTKVIEHSATEDVLLRILDGADSKGSFRQETNNILCDQDELKLLRR